jgi:hypothetical protein
LIETSGLTKKLGDRQDALLPDLEDWRLWEDVGLKSETNRFR